MPGKIRIGDYVVDDDLCVEEAIFLIEWGIEPKKQSKKKSIEA